MGCGASSEARGNAHTELYGKELKVPQAGKDGGEGKAAGRLLAHRPDNHISKVAVSLAWLKRFSALLPASCDGRPMTSGPLITELVKPATSSKKCCYTDLMLADPAQVRHVSRGRPFFFVSHVWGRPFARTVAMVAHHFRPEQQRLWRRGGQTSAAADGSSGPVLPPVLQDEDIFLWFDMFAINQHHPTTADGGLLVLHEALADAEGTLMVLDDQGIILTRIWCLYEAWQTHVVRPGKLRLLSYGIEAESLKQVFLDLDVSRAQATQPEDLARILAAIQTHMGSLEAMTHALKDALVAGAVAQVPPPEGEEEGEQQEQKWQEGQEGQEGQQGQEEEKDAAVRGRSWEEDPQLLSPEQGALEAALQQEPAPEPDQDATPSSSATAADLLWDEDVGYLIHTAGRLCELYGRLPLAEKLYRRNVAGATRKLGLDSRGTLNLMGALARVLIASGAYNEAERLFRQVLAASRRVMGPEHPDTLTTAHNLSTLLLTIAGVRSVKSVGSDQQSGSEAGKEAGERQPAVAPVAAEAVAEAESLIRETLEARRRVLGPEDPETLTTLINLACMLDGAGKQGEAEPLYRQVLEGRRRVLGPHHPDTLNSLNNLGYMLRTAGRLGEAEPVIREALEGRQLVLGLEHPDTLTTVNVLGSLMESIEKYSEAEGLYRRCWEGRRRVLGPEHRSTLTAACNLAYLLHAVQKYDEAEELLRHAVAGKQRVLGAHNPDTLSTASNLAGLLIDVVLQKYDSAKHDEAEKLTRQVLDGRRQVLGADHPDTLASLNNLATLLLQLTSPGGPNRHAEAEPLLRQVLETQERLLGPDHLKTLTTATNLALLFFSWGKTEKAEPLLLRALEGRRRVLGPEHPETQLTAVNLACMIDAGGRLQEAETLFEQVLEARQRVLGPDHKDTMATARRLADVRQRRAGA